MASRLALGCCCESLQYRLMLPFYMLAMPSDVSPSGDYTIMVFLYCIYALIGFLSRESDWKLVKRCNGVRDLIHHDQWFFSVNYERNITVYNDNFEEIWKCTTPYFNRQPGAYHLQFFKASGRLVVLQLSSYAVSMFNIDLDLLRRYENPFTTVGRLGDHTIFWSFGRPIALPADCRHLPVSKLGRIYMAAKDSIIECNVAPDEDGNYSKFYCERELQLLAEEFGYYRYSSS